MYKTITISLAIIFLGISQTALGATSEPTREVFAHSTAEPVSEILPINSPQPITTGNIEVNPIKITPPPSPQSGKVETEWKVEEGTKIAPSPSTQKGNVDTDLKAEKGESASPSIEPDEIDFIDGDDDEDGVLSKEEDLDESMSVRSVTVRGWDPKKKEEFLSDHKEAVEVRSKHDLEHFAQGVLLRDEKIKDVQFNPKELSVSYEAEGKLLWLIPMSYTERLSASGEEGGEVTFKTKKPWWGFLVSANDDGEKTADKAKQKHKDTMQIPSWSLGASNQALLLNTISTVLKTKHDEVKN